MRDFRTVFKFYLSKHLRSKGFIIITALMCAASIIIMIIMNSFMSVNKKEKLYIVNHIEKLNSIWDSKIYHNNSIGNLKLDFSMLKDKEPDSKLVEKAKEKNISIAVFEEANGEITMNVIDDGKINYADISCFQNITKQIVQTKNAIEAGISLDVLKNINATINIKNTNINTAQESNVTLPFILFLVMIMFIILYSNAAVNEVAYLKTNRVMEIFSTSVKPLPLFLGVNIASALVPVIQLIITAVCMCGIGNLIQLDLNKVGSLLEIKLSSIKFSTLVIYIILLVLGYFVYAFMSTSFVSIVSKIEDVNSIAIPIAMIGLIQYFIGILALQNDSIVLKICSYIPFTSSSIVFLRYACGYIGIREVIFSFFILAIFVCALAYFGACLFTRGISYYGNLREFLLRSN